MGLTNAGRDFTARAIINDSPTFFTSANAHLGVGNSSTAFATSQTDLVGTNVRKGMDGGYPQRTNNNLTFSATFGDNEANFTWNEWGIFNASSGGTMLNRKVNTSLGTKSGGIWNFEVTLEINN